MSSFRLAAGLLPLALLVACQQEAAPASADHAGNASPGPEVSEPAALVPAGGTGLLPASEGGFVAVEPALLQSVKRAPCALDSLNSQPASASSVSIPADGTLEATGWLVTSRNESPQSFVLLLQNEARTYAALGQGGVSRQDVARALGAPSADRAGFRLKSALGGEVEPGDYQVLLAQDSGGSITVCNSRYSVEVTAQR